VTRIKYYRDLILVLVGKEFKVRYKSTFLGYVWSVLNPLAFALVYWFVFGRILGVRAEHFPLFLITGLFPWQWFLNSVNGSNYAFLGNDSLIKKVRFPRAFLVLAGVLNDLIHFLVSIPVIVLFMLYYGMYPSLSWVWLLPLLAGVQFALTFSVALFVGTSNLFFRDLERLTVIFTMMWFFLTPIIYPVSMIPTQYRWGLYVNPMAAMIMCWRAAFLEGRLPLGYLAVAAAFSAVACVLSGRMYRALQWRFAEIV